MSGPAERALEQGRAMVAHQKEREAADMEIKGGEGRKFSHAEQAVLDLTSNQQKNVEIVQKAIDAAVGAATSAQARAAIEAPLRAEIGTLQEQLAEARRQAGDSTELRAAAKEHEDAFAEQNQRLSDAIARAEKAEAELASIREAAALGIIGPAVRAGLPTDAPTPDPLASSTGPATNQTIKEESAPAAGAGAAQGDTPAV